MTGLDAYPLTDTSGWPRRRRHHHIRTRAALAQHARTASSKPQCMRIQAPLASLKRSLLSHIHLHRPSSMPPRRVNDALMMARFV